MTKDERTHIDYEILKRVKEEVDNYRALEHYIKTETRNAVIKVTAILGFFSLIAGILGFFGWDYIMKRITADALSTVGEHIARDEAQKLIKSQLGEMIDRQVPRLIDSSVPQMISNKVSVTELAMRKGFAKQVDDMAAELRKESQDLALKESYVEKRLDLIPKMAAARAGSRRDYDELRAMLNGTNEFAKFVESTVRGIEKSYWAKKISKEDFYLILSHGGQKFEIEQYVDLVHADLDQNCDGAINELVALGRKEFVSTLVYAVKNSKRLNSVYLAIAGIEKLSGRPFKPLGIDEVNQWWSQNSTNEVYNSPYESYRLILENEGLRQREGVVCNEGSATNLLVSMSMLMEKNPTFMPVVKSVLIQSVLLPVDPMHKFEEGRREIYEHALDYAKSQMGDTDRWWNFKAYHDVYYGDFVGTVTNRLEKSPMFEEEMKRSGFYNPSIFDDPKFNWPSKRPKPTKPSVPLTPANAIRTIPRQLLSSASGPDGKDCIGGVGMVTANIRKGKRVLSELPFAKSDTITEKLGIKRPPDVVEGDAFSWTLDGVEQKYVFDGKVWRDARGKDASDVVLPFGLCPISYERVVDKATTISFAGSVNVSD